MRTTTTTVTTAETSAGVVMEGETLADIVRAHGPLLFARAQWLTRSYADAWDLFQGTMEKALRARNRAIPAEKIVSWLTTIMNNRFLDIVRRPDSRALPLTERLLETLPAEAPSAQALWKVVDDESLEAAVARMPTRLGVVLKLHSKGVSYQEMSRALGVPVQTIGSRLHRARIKVRALLTDDLPAS